MPDRLKVGAVVDGYGSSTRAVLEMAEHAEKTGMDSVWLSQMPNQREVGTVVAGLAVATQRVSIASAVLPMYTRPPVIMAQSAMTTDELSGGRVVLGLGLGHRGVGDWMVGSRPVPPVTGTREYLTIVTSLIREGEVSFDGRFHSGHAAYSGQRREDLPVLLGAFGPKMLEVAGELADGVILWMCTPEYVSRHAFAALRRGWQRRGGRPSTFSVVAMMHAGVSPEPDRDREVFARLLSSYLRVATYRKLFEASGFTEAVAANRPEDTIVRALASFGGEDIGRRMAEYRQAGVDEIAVVAAGTAAGSVARCLDTLAAANDIARALDSP